MQEIGSLAHTTHHHHFPVNTCFQGRGQKLFLFLRQAIAKAERQISFRQKSGIQLQDLWVKFQISAHSFSASLPQLYPAEDRIINELTPWESGGCLFIGVSSCCSNQVRFHFHQFHPTFLSYYMQCSFRHEKTLFSPSDFEQRFRQTFLISDWEPPWARSKVASESDLHPTYSSYIHENCVPHPEWACHVMCRVRTVRSFARTTATVKARNEMSKQIVFYRRFL